MDKTGHLCSIRHPTPRCRSPRLSGPKPGFLALSGPLRRSIAPLRHTCKLCFDSSIPLIITIIHWINEGPNVRPEKFQFLEKWQNRNFNYKIVNFG